MNRWRALLITFLLLWPPVLLPQANGKLQIHFMAVGQGDGAVLISPLGEVVLFDNGVRNQCDKPLSYLGVAHGPIANSLAAGLLVSFGGSFFNEVLGAVREFNKAQESVRKARTS